MTHLLANRHVLSLTGNVLAAGAGFLTLLLLARVLTPGELGKWLMYLTAFTFVDMLRSGLLHTAVIRLYTGTKDFSLIGSAWIIGLIFSTTIGLASLMLWLPFPEVALFSQSEANMVGVCFALLVLVSLPVNVALWVQQAENRFDRLLVLRLLLSIPLLIFVSSGFFFPFRVVRLIQAQTVMYAVASVFTIFTSWAKVYSIVQSNRSGIRQLWQFGRYSAGTLIGTNLLKSSDTLLIGWLLGPAAVALYNFPYKLIELVEIPLRSTVATALPQLSALSARKDALGLTRLFHQQTGLLTLALLPVALFLLLFAEPLLQLLGGSQYAQSAGIFRVFAVYSLLLPLDRFIGITLDSLNQPQLNLLKVGLMVLLNVAGSWLALHFFHDPLPVAGVTFLMTLGGVLFGAWCLRKTFRINLMQLFTAGYQLGRQGLRKLIHSHAP